jgi:hypothetical protein
MKRPKARSTSSLPTSSGNQSTRRPIVDFLALRLRWAHRGVPAICMSGHLGNQPMATIPIKSIAAAKPLDTPLDQLAELGHSQIQSRPLTKKPRLDRRPDGARTRALAPMREACRKRQMDRTTGLAGNNPGSTIYPDCVVSANRRALGPCSTSRRRSPTIHKISAKPKTKNRTVRISRIIPKPRCDVLVSDYFYVSTIGHAATEDWSIGTDFASVCAILSARSSQA